MPAGLRQHLVSTLAAALQADAGAEPESVAGTAAELLVVALEELAATDGQHAGEGDGSEKTRRKTIAQAVRRRGEAIIRRVRRDARMRARMLAAQPGQGGALLREAEQATVQAKQAGETITSQHARLRAARSAGGLDPGYGRRCLSSLRRLNGHSGAAALGSGRGDAGRLPNSVVCLNSSRVLSRVAGHRSRRAARQGHKAPSARFCCRAAGGQQDGG